MSKKITVIAIIAILCVCLITGAAFAVWSKLDGDRVFRFSASDLELNISSDRLNVDNVSLTPYNTVNASFMIEVVGEKSTVAFSLASLTFNGGDNGEFIPVPDGVVEVLLPKKIYGIGGEAVKNADCNLTMRFNPDIEPADLDPFYMNKQYKFTVTAKATKYVIPTQYTITYINVGEDVINDNITTYSIETNYTFKDASRNGYNFMGWYLDNAFTMPITELVQDTEVNNISVYAKWSEPIDYTIEYVDGYSMPNANPTVYDIETETITLIDLSKDGYDFLGWYDAETGGNKITEIVKGSTGNITLYAHWAVADYSITYVDSLSAPNNNPTAYTIETPTITLEPLVKDGYAFVGWFDAETGGNAVTEIALGEFGNKILYARWTAVGFTIDYIDPLNAVNNNPTDYDTETAVTFTDLVKDGYNFLGWYDAETGGNKITEIPVGSLGNKTLYARWSEPIAYTIEYRDALNADNSANATSFTVESAAITLAPLTADGYTFSGWFDAETGGNQVTEIPAGSFGNKVLFARWETISYAIVYENVYDADNTANPVNYDVTAAVVLSDISRNGYTFAGWFDAATGGNKVTGIALGSTGNKTFYARWDAITYSITYLGLEGADNSANTATQYTIETADIVLSDISRNGYTFLGWFDAETGGNKVTQIPTGSTGDKSLYARWEIINYTITYEGLEGADNSYHPATYTVNDNVKFSVIIRQGYDFVGWFDAPTGGNQITEIPAGSTGNKTLYAQWTPIIA